jgi:hypothetical protein
MLQADDRLTTDSHTSDTTDARIMTIPAQLQDAVKKFRLDATHFMIVLL